jgi:hypothetical protein
MKFHEGPTTGLIGTGSPGLGTGGSPGGGGKGDGIFGLGVGNSGSGSGGKSGTGGAFVFDMIFSVRPKNFTEIYCKQRAYPALVSGPVADISCARRSSPCDLLPRRIREVAFATLGNQLRLKYA